MVSKPAEHGGERLRQRLTTASGKTREAQRDSARRSSKSSMKIEWYIGLRSKCPPSRQHLLGELLLDDAETGREPARGLLALEDGTAKASALPLPPEWLPSRWYSRRPVRNRACTARLCTADGGSAARSAPLRPVHTRSEMG